MVFLKNNLKKGLLVFLSLLSLVAPFPTKAETIDQGFITVNEVKNTSGGVPDENYIVIGKPLSVNANITQKNLSYAKGEEGNVVYVLCASDDPQLIMNYDTTFGYPACGTGMREIAKAKFTPTTLVADQQSQDGFIKLSNLNSTGLLPTDKYLFLGVGGPVTFTDSEGLHNRIVLARSPEIPIEPITQAQADALILAKKSGGTIDDVTGYIKDGAVSLRSKRIAAQITAAKNPDFHTDYIEVLYDDGKNEDVINSSLCKCSIDKIEWRTEDNSANYTYKDFPAYDFQGDGKRVNNNFNTTLLSSPPGIGDDWTVRVNVFITDTATGQQVKYTDTKNLFNFDGLDTTDSNGQRQKASDFPTDNSLLGLVARIINFLIYLVLSIIYGVMQTVITPLLQVLLSIQVHTPEFSTAILSGWATVRNITNIFFILALLAMAVGTLLDIHSYTYKELLGRLVLMALLVNFSLVIARVILGVADTIQAQFIPFGNHDVINNLAYQMIVTPTKNLADTASGGLSAIVGGVVFLIFGLAAFMAFLALAVFLIIRIVAIMILLITSPIAYAGTVFGDHSALGHLGKQWWDNFIKYAFFTPVIAFFMNLAAVIAIAQSNFLTKTTGVVFPQATSPTFAQGIYNILSNVIVIALLFAGIKVAKSFHLDYMTKVVDKFSGGFNSAVTGAGRMGAGYLQTRKQELTADWASASDTGKPFGNLKAAAKRAAFRVANPKTSFDATKERLEVRGKNAEKLAKEGAKRATYYDASRGHIDTKGVDKAKGKIDDEGMERYLKSTGEEMHKKVLEMQASGYAKTREGQAEMRRVFKAALVTGNMQDMMKKDPEFANKPFNSETQKEFMVKHLGEDPEYKRFVKNLEDVAKEKNKLMYIGMSEKTPKEQEQKQLSFIKNSKAEDLSTIDFKGVKPGELGANGAFLPTNTYTEVVDKLAKNGDAPLSKSVIEYLGPVGIDSESGSMIFESEAQEKGFRQLMATQPELATRVYNKAIGADRETSIADIRTQDANVNKVMYFKGPDGVMKKREDVGQDATEFTPDNSFKQVNVTQKVAKKLDQEGHIRTRRADNRNQQQQNQNENQQNQAQNRNPRVANNPNFTPNQRPQQPPQPPRREGDADNPNIIRGDG